MKINVTAKHEADVNILEFLETLQQHYLSKQLHQMKLFDALVLDEDMFVGINYSWFDNYSEERTPIKKATPSQIRIITSLHNLIDEAKKQNL